MRVLNNNVAQPPSGHCPLKCDGWVTNQQNMANIMHFTFLSGLYTIDLRSYLSSQIIFLGFFLDLGLSAVHAVRDLLHHLTMQVSHYDWIPMTKGLFYSHICLKVV